MKDELCGEIPNSLAAAEMSAEQNYNMIDGLRNNTAVPKADLTDGQTHEEIRELAPEALAGEKPSVLEQIKEAKDAPRLKKESEEQKHNRFKSDLER